MRLIRAVVLILCLLVSQFVANSSDVQAKPLSTGCGVLNNGAVLNLQPGASMEVDENFELGEAIEVTATLDSATKGQFAILGRDQKPIVAPLTVPGKLIYPILVGGKNDLTFESMQSATDGTIFISIRCLPGVPITPPSGSNQLAEGSKALVNDLNGKSLALLSSPDGIATVVAAFPRNTVVTLTVAPLQINNNVWYRVRANLIEGWTLAKVTLDGKQFDSLVPYSDQLLDQTITALNGKTDPASLFEVANAYFAKDQFDQSLAKLAELIKLDPKNVQAYTLQGLIQLYRQDHQAALHSFSAAVNLSPKDAMLYELRGFTLTISGDFDEALMDLNFAIELNSEFTTAYKSRGALFVNTMARDEATADLGEALRIDPLFATAQFFMSYLAFRQENLEVATLWINRAIKMEPMNSVFFDLRGVIFTSLESYDQAIRDIKHAIELDPNNAQAYFDLGEVYLALDKIDAAIDSYTQSVQLKDPDNGCKVCAYMRLGQVYFSQGEYDKAIENYTHAIELDPNYADAYIERAKAYVSKGDTASAQADAQKAQDLKQSGQATSH